MHRVFRKSLESLVQTRKILLRLLQSEIENRVFVDSIEISSGFRGKTIDGVAIDAARLADLVLIPAFPQIYNRNALH